MNGKWIPASMILFVGVVFLSIFFASGAFTPPMPTSTPYPTIPSVEASKNCTSVKQINLGSTVAMTECTFPDGLRCVAYSGGGISCDWSVDHK